MLGQVLDPSPQMSLKGNVYGCNRSDCLGMSILLPYHQLQRRRLAVPYSEWHPISNTISEARERNID